MNQRDDARAAETTAPAASQALARRTAAEEPALIVSPKALEQKLEEWHERKYHVLTPVTRILGIAPQHGINVSLVVLDAGVDKDTGVGPEVYYSKEQMKPNERALGKVALMKIAQAAGISFVDPHGMTSDPRIQFYWAFRTTARFRGFDGSWQTMPGSGEVDLRDGSPEIGGWTAEAWAELEAKNRAILDKNRDAKVSWVIGGWSKNRVMQRRRFGLRLAETQAMERAVRAYGVRHKYTVEELQKPFVVLRLSYIPDMTDPEIRAMVAREALSGVSTLYPGADPAPRALGPAVNHVIDVRPSEPTQEERASTPANGGDAPSTSEKAEVPEGAVYIEKVEQLKTGENENGNKWTRWGVTVSTGEQFYTFDDDLADEASEWMRTKVPVRPRTKAETKYGVEVTSFVNLAQQPELKL